MCTERFLRKWHDSGWVILNWNTMWPTFWLFTFTAFWAAQWDHEQPRTQWKYSWLLFSSPWFWCFWGLSFLRGVCLTGWVDTKHTCFIEFYFSFYDLLSCLIHPHHALCVCPVCCFVLMCCGSPNSPHSLPSPFWLRCFRWSPQTHSDIFTQSGYEHDPERPRCPQTGVQRPGLITC